MARSKKVYLKKLKTKKEKKEKALRPFLKFKNKIWLESSLAHPSYRNENPSYKFSHDFDRLEFFGDCVLNYVVCRKLFAKFPQADEGLLSRLRSILVSRKILSRIVRETDLTKHLKLGRGLQGQDDFLKSKIYADAYEAVIAAIYFDQGFDKTEKFLLKCFAGYFDIKKLFRLDPNPKSTLQELSQRHWQKLPH
jgi:ribonuclease-3